MGRSMAGLAQHLICPFRRRISNFSDGPALSANGRFVAFTSWASNLVPDDTNGDIDVFVHDLQQGKGLL
jgi:hypothetical protein